jgi:hypothetical protein
MSRATFADPGLAELVAARGRVLSIVTQEFLDG